MWLILLLFVAAAHAEEHNVLFETKMATLRSKRLGQLNPFVEIESKACNSSYVKCSCCGYCGTAESYITVGAPSRYLGECPECRSRERHRESCKLLGRPPISNSFCKKEGKFHLLHFGPEQNMAAQIEKLKCVDQIRVDYLLQPYARRYGSRVHTIYHTDVQQLQYPDGFVDGAIILHVLEHVENTQQSLNELFRVLRQGGWMLIEVPCDVDGITFRCEPGVRSRICSQRDHIWNFGCNEFQSMLETTGFHCTRHNEWLPYTAYEKHKHGPEGRIQPQWLCLKN